MNMKKNNNEAEKHGKNAGGPGGGEKAGLRRAGGRRPRLRALAHTAREGGEDDAGHPGRGRRDRHRQPPHERLAAGPSCDIHTHADAHAQDSS